jgi:hypothetical protein
MNAIPTHDCDYSLHTSTKKYSHHICKHVDIALLSSKNVFPHYEMNSLAISKSEIFIITLLTSTKGNLHYEDNKKNNTCIKMANPPLGGLWDWHYPHISKQKVIVLHVMCEILCNIKMPTHQPIVQHLLCFSLSKDRTLYWHAQRLLPKLTMFANATSNKTRPHSIYVVGAGLCNLT